MAPCRCVKCWSRVYHDHQSTVCVWFGNRVPHLIVINQDSWFGASLGKTTSDSFAIDIAAWPTGTWFLRVESSLHLSVLCVCFIAFPRSLISCPWSLQYDHRGTSFFGKVCSPLLGRQMPLIRSFQPHLPLTANDSLHLEFTLDVNDTMFWSTYCNKNAVEWFIHLLSQFPDLVCCVYCVFSKHCQE